MFSFAYSLHLREPPAFWVTDFGCIFRRPLIRLMALDGALGLYFSPIAGRCFAVPFMPLGFFSPYKVPSFGNMSNPERVICPPSHCKDVLVFLPPAVPISSLISSGRILCLPEWSLWLIIIAHSPTEPLPPSRVCLILAIKVNGLHFPRLGHSLHCTLTPSLTSEWKWGSY